MVNRFMMNSILPKTRAPKVLIAALYCVQTLSHSDWKNFDELFERSMQNYRQNVKKCECSMVHLKCKKQHAYPHESGIASRYHSKSSSMAPL